MNVAIYSEGPAMLPTIKWRCCLGLVQLALCTSLGCTIPTFEHPLVSPSEAKAHTELYGSYQRIDEDKSTILYSHVGYAGEGFPPGFVRIIDVQMHKDPAQAPLRSEIICFLAQVEGHYVLHMPINEVDKLANKSQTNWSGPWDKSKVKGYILARITKQDDDLLFGMLHSDFVEEQIKAKTLSGEVREKTIMQQEVATEVQKTITVTAKPDELQTFFAKNIKGKLFDQAGPKFSRLK